MKCSKVMNVVIGKVMKVMMIMIMIFDGSMMKILVSGIGMVATTKIGSNARRTTLR